jgi:DNA-binding transcriptional regulator YbjK
VLAADGARGLTHRAVDRAAGLPEGSSSNVFRTRDALLAGALERHLELDLAAGGSGDEPSAGAIGRGEAAALILATVEHIRASRTLLVARYELFLEATRRPELAAAVAAARTRVVELTGRVLAASGCRHPDEHARTLVACLDGLLLDDVIGAPAALSGEEVAATVERLLASC